MRRLTYLMVVMFIFGLVVDGYCGDHDTFLMSALSTETNPPTAASATASMASCSMLPSTYIPGSPVQLSIAVTPSDSALVYAVEDAPPSGWTVSGISDGGEFDSNSRKVKWGPFFDNTIRILTYSATPPASESASRTFAGTASFDGNDVAITGARTILKNAIPIVKITAPTSTPEYATTNQSLSIAGSASGISLVSVAWSNDRGGNGTCTGTTSWSANGIALQEGENVITVTAADAAGNVATTALTVTFTDVTAPAIKITVPTSASTYTTTTSSVIIKGFASDNVGVLIPTWSNHRGGSGTCTIDRGTWASSKIALQPGANILTATVTDAAGNKGTATITVTFNDVTPPAIKITSPTSTGTYATTRQIMCLVGLVSDDFGVASVGWSNNRGGSGTCTSAGTWTSSNITLLPGDNIITVTAKDASGNKGTASLTVTYTDATAPTVFFTSPVSTATYSTASQTLAIKGTASDNVGLAGTVTWSNSRGGSGTCTGTTSWSANGLKLLPGVNVITVTATDAAGNKGSGKLTVTYTDVTPPAIRITVPTTAATYSTTTQALIIRGFTSDNVGVTAPTWSSDRGVSGTCSIVTGTYATSKISLQPGANVFTVTETDAAGNKATATITVTYTDITSPVVKITVPTTAATYTTNTSSIILKGFTSDNVGVMTPTWTNDRGGSGTCTIDRGTWATGKINLQPGVNVLTVTETDAAGNKGTATIKVTFNDVTAPVVKITVPSSTGFYSTGIRPSKSPV